MEMQLEKKLLPAYVSFKTFLAYLEGLKHTMPHQIDRSTMGTLSGSAQSQLLGSLEYLKLIESDKKPTSLLDKLIKADSNERQKVVKEVIETAYSPLFKNGFSLEKATPKQLEEFFKESGATGNTVNQCLSFLINFAKYGAMMLSPFLAKRGKGVRTNKPQKPRRQQDVNGSEEFNSNPLPKTPLNKKEQTLKCLVDILSPEMPKDVRDSTWVLIQYLKNMHQKEKDV